MAGVEKVQENEGACRHYFKEKTSLCDLSLQLEKERENVVNSWIGMEESKED
jgi:hypothetical protein